MKNRTKRTAEQFGILDKVEKLEQDLLKVEGVVSVDFDLDGFYDNLNQVIFLTKYDIPANAHDYFKRRRQLIVDAQVAAYNNGLKRTEDRIEDYGAHFYFVMRCDDSWKIKDNAVQ